MKIPILRLGDTSKVSVVRVHTKDGSATSGDDYNPLSEGNTPLLPLQSVRYVFFQLFLNKSLFIEDIEFKEGEKEHWVEIDILYDGQREMREAFTVHLKPDDNMVAEIQVTQRPRSKHTPANRKQESTGPGGRTALHTYTRARRHVSLCENSPGSSWHCCQRA